MSAKVKMIRQILDDVESLTKQRFYEPPDQEQGPAEVFQVRDGRSGEAFDSLPIAQQVQVFSEHLDLDAYEAGGISFRQLNQIFWNVVEGKPRDEWLDGTGLRDPGRKKSLAELMENATDKAKQPEHRKTHGRELDRG